MRRVLGMGLALAIGLAACSGDATGPGDDVAAPSGHIAFESDGNVWLLDVSDGSVVGIETSPALGRLSWRHSPWSADGGRLIFTVFGEETSELWSYEVSSGQAQRLTDGHSDHSPHWSPDGSEILFVRGTQGLEGSAGGIQMIPAAGGPTRGALADPDRDVEPAWSPNGSRFAFLSSRASTMGAYGLWTVPRSGAEPSLLIPEHSQWFSWAPSGDELVVGRQIDGDRFGLERVTLSGVRTLLPLPEGSDLYTPTWSPDGRQLLAAGRTGAGPMWIQVSRADGSERIVLGAVGQENEWPSWSPDGAWVGYQSERGETSAIYAARVTDGEERMLLEWSAPIGTLFWAPR